MCAFSYGHLFLVSIFYQLTSQKNQVHTVSSTPYDWETLKLFKFYLIKNLKGMEEITYHYSIFGS